MSSRIDDLLEHIALLERELEAEFNHARADWRYRLDAGRVRFEGQVRRAHLRLQQSVPLFIRQSNPVNLLTAPLLYSLIVPIAAQAHPAARGPERRRGPHRDRRVSHPSRLAERLARDDAEQTEG